MKEKPAGFEIFRVERGQTAVGPGRCSCHRDLSEAHEKPELHFLFFISPKEGLEPPINSISVTAECSRCGWDGKQESRKEKKERGGSRGRELQLPHCQGRFCRGINKKLSPFETEPRVPPCDSHTSAEQQSLEPGGFTSTVRELGGDFFNPDSKIQCSLCPENDFTPRRDSSDSQLFFSNSPGAEPRRGCAGTREGQESWEQD